MTMDVLVVGAGFAGSVVAERLASAGKRVLVIEKRDHIAGNAFDEYDSHGVLVHKYGPHIFHTNSMLVVDYLSRFTAWRDYEHRVLAKVDGALYPIPINQDTINRLYDLDLDEAGIERFPESVREPRTQLRTSEDVVLSTVGHDLCDKFFRGYTRKQWGRGLSELSTAVAARIPVRTNRDSRYFSDSFQKMPRDGSTSLFRNLLTHPNIRVEVGTDYENLRDRIKPELTVYSGPIDGYFNHCYGRLPYRSLRFEHEHIQGVEQYQPVAVVNYPNEEAFTRVTEFKQLTGQGHPGTSIVKEYSQSEGEPYYPIPSVETQALYKRYEELAHLEHNVVFVGRLAQYRYFNMDQVVAAALKVAGHINSGLSSPTARANAALIERTA